MTGTVATDWRKWHKAYDDPDSSLTRRLAIVRRRVGEALELLAAKPPLRILSLCSGRGLDLLPALAGLEHDRYQAFLVEKDQELARDAIETAGQLGLGGVEIVIGDAGRTTTFAHRLPVDLLMLCGIFGNICDDDVAATVAAIPALLADGGVVIWTRGSSDPDLRRTIRSWITDTGLVETSWDDEPEGYGVGVARRRPDARQEPVPVPERLFTFVR